MSFFFRLLTLVELIIWLKRIKEINEGDVAQTRRRNADSVHDSDGPSRGYVLDDVQTESRRHTSDFQSTECRQDTNQERNL